ncbi:MAG: hypothetical protein E7Z88_01500 [Cyanobacteria bacterium SIG27]|nr:hypothetical protein [Cyanobacteria bacterium SIG27]
MYIIELFLKLKEDFKNGKFKKKIQQPINEIETCSHLFVPIDSTGKILACSKCGELYKLKDGEINPFEN